MPWNSGIACQNLAFFIRLRIDVWPGQRDGRRLFRHAVPGCFPDSKGVFWLAFCAWDSGIACQNLDFFIRLRSDVWPGQRDGRRPFRHAMPGCVPDLKFRVCCGLVSAPGTVELPARSLIFSFGSGVTLGPGRGTAGGCSVTPCQGVLKGVFWLAFCAWNSGFACQNLDVFIGSGVTFGRPKGRQSRRGATMRVFWLALCALEQWNCLPEPIRFRSDVWRGEGRQRCSVTPCQGVFLTPARTLIFSFGSGVTFGPGRGTAGGCSVTPCQGVFLTRRVLACSPRLEQCKCLPEP